ncbi:hypothetical protein MTR_8g091860 [Medicago truncatula]|uniref:Uncharacterized protein n=1 Tax=Medicago truncatula TaxID=3880 RepID=G7LBA3_MEDTR|nr:hypothetical protein MTR_8g091860 [Medicago truncatula]
MVVVNRSGYVMNSIVCDGLNIFNTTSCVIVIIHKMHLCGYNSLIEKEVSILGWFCSATHRRSFLAWSGYHLAAKKLANVGLSAEFVNSYSCIGISDVGTLSLLKPTFRLISRELSITCKLLLVSRNEPSWFFGSSSILPMVKQVVDGAATFSTTLARENRLHY